MRLRLLPIAQPCRESFSDMPGDEKTRFCGKCGKHVYDLSERTEEEARALFAARKQGRTCVRYAKDARGGIRFKAAAFAAVVSVAACSAPAVDTAAPATAHDADDRDMGDAVVDVDDRCPDPPTPEAVADGCPDADAGATSTAN